MKMNIKKSLVKITQNPEQQFIISKFEFTLESESNNPQVTGYKAISQLIRLIVRFYLCLRAYIADICQYLSSRND